MRYFASAIALLLLCSLAFPSFTFLYSSNGSAKLDPDNYYAFSLPTSLYLAGGILYVGDGGKGLLYMLNASNGLSRIRAVGSPSTGSYLNNPMHMDYDYQQGLLYIAGGSSGNILYYNGEGSTLDKWNPSTTNLQKANGLALTSDSIYVTDGLRGQVVAFSRATKAYSRIVLQSGGSDGLLSSPQDILFNGGKVYISDSGKGLIFVYDSNFTFLYTVGRGKGGVNLISPRGMDFDDNRLYVADSSAGNVVAFSLDGYPVDILNSSTEWGNLSYPEDVIVDNGTLYVADTQNQLVKAFSINKTGGDPAVLAAITGANASCASMASMQSVASKIGVPFSPVAYADSISSAQQYYDDYAFSYASSLAGKAKGDCTSAQALLSQSVDVKIRQMIQSSQGQVAPYRNAPSTNATQLAQFDNKASAALFALSSKNYASASDTALSLPALASAIAAGSQEAAANEGETKQNQSLSLVGADVASLSYRIERLQEKAGTYRQDINLSGAQDLLALAQKNAQGGDFAAANRSLELVGLEITTYETTIDAAAKEIDIALSSLAVTEIEFNATASRAMLFAPDLSHERSLMSQAGETVYSSPQAALQLAAQAKASEEAKSRDSQALSLAAASVLVMLFFIAIIAAGFFIHIRGRHKKGM